jgi:hypothetical protein
VGRISFFFSKSHVEKKNTRNVQVKRRFGSRLLLTGTLLEMFNAFVNATKRRALTRFPIRWFFPVMRDQTILMVFLILC